MTWARQVGALTDREVLIAGAVAYWAEGTKAKPWRPEEHVSFTNSDPDMIRLFLRFLALLEIGPERLRFRVSIHETADAEEATSWWADVVGIAAGEFQRATLKRNVPATNRKNVGSDYHGCLVVRVLNGAALYRRIEGIWWAVAEHASNLGSQSRVV